MRTIKPSNLVMSLHLDDEGQKFHIGEIIQVNGSKWIVVQILLGTWTRLVIGIPEHYLEGEEWENYLKQYPEG